MKKNSLQKKKDAERRAAEKERRKRLRAEARTPIIPIVCRPGDEMSLPLYMLGWALRSLVLFFGIFGLVLFVGDGFGFFGENGLGSILSLFLVSLALTVICSAAAWNSRLALIAPVVGVVAGVGVLFNYTSNPFLLIWDGIRCVVNTAMDRMVDLGYSSFGNFIIGSESYTAGTAIALNTGCAVLCTVIAVILALSLLRKVHALPAVITSVLFIAPVFIYNLTKGNGGISMVLCFTLGEICLLFYEKKFSGYEARRAAKKAARAAKKAEKRAKKVARAEEKARLKETALRAYAISLELTGDKSEAKLAKKAVYSLAIKKKADDKKAERKRIRDDAAAEKEARRKAKAEAKAKAAADKKALAAMKAGLKNMSPDKSASARAELEQIARDKRLAKKTAAAERRRARAEAEESKRKSLSASGFAGGLAILLALLSVWLPFSVITGDFITIDFIDKPISVAREYITAYLKGDDIDLNNLRDVAELTPRTLTFDSPLYENYQIFSIESENDDPLYLRGWIGTDFDAKTGTWSSATSDEVKEYRKLFGKDFTPDSLKTDFLNYLFPAVKDNLKTDENNIYLQFSKFGFAVRQIHLRRINDTSLIVYAAPYLYSDLGLLEHGTMTPISDRRYSEFFEGIYSSRFLSSPGTAYSAVSLTPVMNDLDISSGLTSLSAYYDLFLDYIDIADELYSFLNSKISSSESSFTYNTMRQLSGTITVNRVEVPHGEPENVRTLFDITDLNRAFEEECRRTGISVPTAQESLLLRYLRMSEEEQRELLKFTETEIEYREWVWENYSGSIYDPVVTDLAEAILADAGFTRTDNASANKTYTPVYKDTAGRIVDEHTVIMTVINYLKDNYEYTLEPTVYEGDDKTVLNAFLTDTKDGYCIHFTTAAAILLREMGYSVRFAEGYLVSSFNTSYSEDRNASYQQFVYDNNAHSWIEVYYPYSGWVPYETVPIYNELFYTPPTAENPNPGVPDPPPQTNPPTDIPEEDLPEDEPDKPDIPVVDVPTEEDSGDPMLILMILGITVAAVILLFFIIRLIVRHIMKKAENIVADRHRHIVVGMDTELLRSGKIDTLPIAREYDDTILRILDLLGYGPMTGEQFSQYAARLEVDFGGMTDYSLDLIFDLVAKVEFGGGLTPDEMYVLADFTDRLTTSTYAGFSLFEKIRYRYLKHLI